MVNLNFNRLVMTENLSMDEMMIPYCGNREQRVYGKGKPAPWGSVAITENWFPPDYTSKTVILDLKHPDFRNIPHCTIFKG